MAYNAINANIANNAINQMFYNIFYDVIENIIANFINTDNNLRNIISIEDKKKHILSNAFPLTNFNSTNDLMNLINNNLDVYLKIVNFVKEKELPFMPGLIDFTQLNYVFNRFFYHYAKLCMNNECVFSQTIHVRMLNLQYI
jgi:hypothetical protein